MHFVMSTEVVKARSAEDDAAETSSSCSSTCRSRWGNPQPVCFARMRKVFGYELGVSAPFRQCFALSSLWST